MSEYNSVNCLHSIKFIIVLFSKSINILKSDYVVLHRLAIIMECLDTNIDIHKDGNNADNNIYFSLKMDCDWMYHLKPK